MRLGWRSMLFVPAHDTTKIIKAAASAADAVILDLEDGVAADAKAAARAGISDAAALLSEAGKAVVVRVNSAWRAVLADLDASVRRDVSAIMVPKAEDRARLAVVAQMIAEFETERGIGFGSVTLLPLIESPLGLGAALALAASRSVIGLALGTEDFSLSLGVEPTSDCLDLPCRQVALAAASADLMAFTVPLSIAAFRDEDAIFACAIRAKAFGATGALCIHPTQVKIANDVFGPSAAALDAARRVLNAWQDAEARGDAVIVVDGQMVDAPVAARARRLLARA